MARQTASVTQKIILLYNLAASWTRDEKKEVRQFADKMLEGLEQQGYFVQPVEVDDDLSVLDPYDPFEWLVFNWCESLGELHASEVLVAKELETRGYAFTGSPSKILKLNYDKWQVKKILRAAKIPTPPGRIMEAEVEAEEWEYFPAIVKPAYQHCSIGITRDSLVETREALIRQVRLIYGEYDQPSLVEPFIDGREFHTAVWGNRKIEALPPVELNFSSFADWRERFYTYECKFIRNSRGMMGIDWHCPAPENLELRAKLETIAISAYRAFGCRDYARMDFRLWNGQPTLLDVNTNPDLHPESVFPMAAEALGFDYAAMAGRLVELAMPRFKRKRTSRKVRQMEPLLAV